MTTIAPNDSNLAYSPANWLVQGSSAETINTGAYINALITGAPTSLTATFDLSGVSTPYPDLAITVDDGPTVRVPVAASVTVPLPTTNQYRKHTVSIVVVATSTTVSRWNRAVSVRFTGFSSPSTIGTERFRQAQDWVLCLGDSISEGFRALGLTDDVKGDDARFGWAHPLRALLGLEVGLVGFAGVGLTKGGNGGVPAVQDSWTQLWSGQPRTFSSTPAAIVINIGTNDQSADAGTVQSLMTSWLQAILASFSAAPIVVLRPFGGYQAAALTAACTAVADDRVTYVDTANWWSAADSMDGTHPYGYCNTSNLSPRIAAAVSSVLAGGGASPPVESNAFIMTSSGLVPLSA